MGKETGRGKKKGNRKDEVNRCTIEEIIRRHLVPTLGGIHINTSQEEKNVFFWGGGGLFWAKI
jgi:hypothetical protein